MDSTESKYLDQFRIIKTLGQGYHAKVKLAQGPDHQLVAIKRFKPETADLETLKHELNIIQQLKHENLVNLVAVRPKATYRKRNGETFPCFAIILEYVGGGQLFDFVALGGKFSTNVTRTYFFQLMNAVNYMHEKGLAHRDIKPENILLTDNYLLKLTDFGFATNLSGKDKSGVLHTKLGTEGYMAPEIQTKNYEGTKADIFSCGVILFIMYTASPPFQRSVATDPYYKLLKDKNYVSFWNFHGKRRQAGFFGDDFKDLIQKMLAFSPSERPTMVQISQHPWVKGSVLSSDMINQEFNERKHKVDQEMEKQKQEQQRKKQARNNALYDRSAVHRGDDETLDAFLENFENIEGQKRSLPLVKNRQGYLVNQEQDYFFSALVTLLSDPVKLNFDDYTISFTPKHQIEDNKVNITFSYQQFDAAQTIGMIVTVSKTPENKMSLQFTPTAGQELYFRRLVQHIKDQYESA